MRPRKPDGPSRPAMDYLPVFLQLRSARAVIVGGGSVAARKAELLLRAGARVTVVAPAAAARSCVSRAAAGELTSPRRHASAPRISRVRPSRSRPRPAGTSTSQFPRPRAQRNVPVNVVDDAASIDLHLPRHHRPLPGDRRRRLRRHRRRCSHAGCASRSRRCCPARLGRAGALHGRAAPARAARARGPGPARVLGAHRARPRGGARCWAGTRRRRSARSRRSCRSPSSPLPRRPAAARSGRSTSSAPGPATRTCSRCARCSCCNRRTWCSTTGWCPRRCSSARGARRCGSSSARCTARRTATRLRRTSTS